MRALKQFIKGFISGQKRFGQHLAGLVNSILLSIVYFIGVGLTSIAAKAVKKKFLELKIDKKSKTYWDDLALKKREMEAYYRQF